MLFYFGNIFIFLIYSGLFFIARHDHRSWYMFVVILHLSLFMGSRSYEVGTDTPQYVGYYLTGNTSFNGNGAWLYSAISSVTNLISNGNYHVFLFVLSFLTVSLTIFAMSAFNSSSKYLILSCYIYITYYFFFDSFNIQRQMLAVAITFFSAALLYKKKYVFSVVTMICGIGIHSTAILMLAIFPLWMIKKTKMRLAIGSVLLIIASVYLTKILEMFSRIFNHYEMYTSIVTGDSLSAGGGTLVLGLFMLLFIILGIWLTDILDDQMNGFVTVMVLVGSTLSIVGMKSQLLIRVSEYFSIYITTFIPIVVPKISKRFVENKVIQGILVTLVVLAGGVICFYKLNNNIGEIVPYGF